MPGINSPTSNTSEGVNDRQSSLPLIVLLIVLVALIMTTVFNFVFYLKRQGAYNTLKKKTETADEIIRNYQDVDKKIAVYNTQLQKLEQEVKESDTLATERISELQEILGQKTVAQEGSSSMKDTAIGPQVFDHMRGSADATVFIIEYGNIECQICTRDHEALLQTVEGYNNKDVALIYRYHMTGEKMEREATAGECAAKLGGETTFWEYIKQAMTTVRQKGTSSISDDELVEVATKVGIEADAFKKCFDEGVDLAFYREYDKYIRSLKLPFGAPLLILGPHGQTIFVKEKPKEIIDTLLGTKNEYYSL